MGTCSRVTVQGDETHIQTDRQTDLQTDRQTNKHTSRQADRQPARHPGRQGEMGGEGDPQNVRPTTAGAQILHGAEARTPKTTCIAPLSGEMIEPRGIARQHTFCIVKRTVLDPKCPFRAGLLHHYDRNPKQNGGARRKSQKVLEIFSQDEASRHTGRRGTTRARFAVHGPH